MSSEFDLKLRAAFPKETDLQTIRTIRDAVALADDAMRNIAWMGNIVGKDSRGLFRRNAVLWKFDQDCQSGILPFSTEFISNESGSSHLLKVSSGEFDAHVVRTPSEGAFPKEAVIRQDRALSNEPDLFEDGKIIPLRELEVFCSRLYAWLAFDANTRGDVTHVCWCMPNADQTRFLSHRNILKTAIEPSESPLEPKAPNPAEKMKFKKDVIEHLADKNKEDKNKN